MAGTNDNKGTNRSNSSGVSLFVQREIEQPANNPKNSCTSSPPNFRYEKPLAEPKHTDPKKDSDEPKRQTIEDAHKAIIDSLGHFNFSDGADRNSLRELADSFPDPKVQAAINEVLERTKHLVPNSNS